MGRPIKKWKEIGKPVKQIKKPLPRSTPESPQFKAEFSRPGCLLIAVLVIAFYTLVYIALK